MLQSTSLCRYGRYSDYTRYIATVVKKLFTDVTSNLEELKSKAFRGEFARSPLIKEVEYLVPGEKEHHRLSTDSQ